VAGYFIDLENAPKLAEQIGTVEKQEVSPEVQSIIDKPISETNFAGLVALDAEIKEKIKN
jgi:hypothetical protein